MMRTLRDLATAFQFLTRVPLPRFDYEADALSRAPKILPLVGAAVGLAMVGINVLLSPHLPSLLAVLIVLLFLVGITGGLHKDGLADSADAFGGGWNRERVLEIMKVSRIGSYGALALIFSVGLRILLLASLPVNRLFPYVVAAEVLARWTILPLGKALPGARDRSGLGAR
jgi:adenosylcobinamide-GDP ribazoletransferase